MAKKIAITTDSNSGIMPTEANERGLFTISMPFIVNGQVYLENLELSSEDFYKHLESNAEISTSQPSTGEVSEFWTKVLEEYDQIVHIPTSSSLSAACNTATALAMEEPFYGKVFVVDNHRMTISLKESVYDALKLRDDYNLSAEEIKEKIEQSAQSAIYLVVDTMTYLKKGGRITAGAAIIGTMLRLKPVLQINGGKIDKFAVCKHTKQAVETIKKAVASDLAGPLKEFADKGEVCFSFASANNQPQVDALIDEFKKLYPNIPVRYVDPVSLSIACHVGPGAFAISVSRFIP